jgi:hypothetical protein
MYIVFSSVRESLETGKKFERNNEGSLAMVAYIRNVLDNNPYAIIRVENYL